MARQLLAMILALTALLLAKADELLRAEPAPALSDLVVTGFEQPVRLRLEVTCDGESWLQHCQAAHLRHIESLFDQLDADDDGRLTSDEAKRLPSPQALSGRSDNGNVYVAFNFRVLDANGDGGATMQELAEYTSQFRQIPLSLHMAKGGRMAGDLFGALDVNRDGILTEAEWLDVARLFENDRDGNRVLSTDELRRPSATVLGPEFVAIPSGRGVAQQPLSFRLESPAASPADVLVSIRLSDIHSPGAPAESCLALIVRQGAAGRGITAEAGALDMVVLKVQGRRLELRVLPPVFRRHEQLRQALIRQFDAVAERSGGQVTLSADLPPILKAVVRVADGNADGILERAELERSLDGVVGASLAAEASRLRLTVFEERRGLATLADRNLDGRLGKKELARLSGQLSGLAGAEGQLTRDDVPATISLVVQRGPFEEAVGPELFLNAGPPWFFRADRNQDGDVDAEEFLGAPDAFRQLDADGDGWIDLDEAVRGDSSVPQVEAVEAVP